MELSVAYNLIQNAKTSLKIDKKDVSSSAINYGMVKLLSGKADAIIGTKPKNTPKQSNQEFLNLIDIMSTVHTDDFSIDTLCLINKMLYNGLVIESGTVRNRNIEINGSSCMDVKMIGSSLRAILKKLNSIPSDGSVSKNDFCAMLSYFYKELLIISPFMYGNALTIRAFLHLFSLSRHFNFDLYKIRLQDIIICTNMAYTSDDVQLLFGCLIKAVTYNNSNQNQKTKLLNPAKSDDSAVAPPPQEPKKPTVRASSKTAINTTTATATKPETPLATASATTKTARVLRASDRKVVPQPTPEPKVVTPKRVSAKTTMQKIPTTTIKTPPVVKSTENIFSKNTQEIVIEPRTITLYPRKTKDFDSTKTRDKQ